MCVLEKRINQRKSQLENNGEQEKQPYLHRYPAWIERDMKSFEERKKRLSDLKALFEENDGILRNIGEDMIHSEIYKHYLEEEPLFIVQTNLIVLMNNILNQIYYENIQQINNEEVVSELKYVIDITESNPAIVLDFKSLSLIGECLFYGRITTEAFTTVLHINGTRGQEWTDWLERQLRMITFPADKERAVKVFCMAEEKQYDKNAMRYLAYMYEHGVCVEKNMYKAEKRRLWLALENDSVSLKWCNDYYFNSLLQTKSTLYSSKPLQDISKEWIVAYLSEKKIITVGDLYKMDMKEVKNQLVGERGSINWHIESINGKSIDSFHKMLNAVKSFLTGTGD